MRRFVKRLTKVGLLAAVIAAAVFGYYRYHYPYGWSHCCDLILANELGDYAKDHGGWFPRGEATPEASLSLLYRQNSWNAYLLRGKTVPESEVKSILERGELLGPDTCGWHYVEGLRSDDNPRLALFWDKAGLGHNGERANGWRRVCFVNGTMNAVEEAQWESFLADQQRMRAELRRHRR